MRTVFLTGATGFIGRHLATALLDRGCEVRCLVRAPDRARHLQRDGLRLVAGSLADVAGWRDALAGCDAVINAGGLVAAARQRDLFATNGDAVGALADACADLETPPPRVHVSSLAAAGPTPRGLPPRVEEDPPAPVSLYGASKRAGEAELERRAGRLPATIVRPGVVFGPHEANFAAVFQMVSALRLHLRMGFRDPPLSVIHVADLVAVLLAAADRGDRLAADALPGGRGIYHACDDREHPSYGELGRRVGRAVGVDGRVLVIPVPLEFAWPAFAAIEGVKTALGQPSIVSRDKLREATAPSWASSAARCRVQLGVAPAATLDERLRETADWLRGARKL
jgi:nucleoside-diphosphate-sugar epimerase